MRRHTHLLIILLISSPLSAATVTVHNTNDDGPDSLRRRVSLANNGDVIIFAESIWGQTIELDSEIEITRSITIQGPGADLMTIRAVSNSRIFLLASTSITVTISGLTLTHGRALGPGGAIKNAANLTIDRCYIHDNRTYPDAVLDGRGGGIFNEGVLTLSRSTLQSNRVNTAQKSVVGLDGGAVYNAAGASLDAESSTFHQNRAGHACEASTEDCPESQEGGSGGAIYNAGQVRVKYSTITNNGTGNGYGVFSDPDAGDGGGFYNEGSSYFKVTSTIVADNYVSFQGRGPDLRGVFHTDSFYNLIESNPGSDYSGFSDPSNYTGVDAQLKVFGDFGGGMPTRRPTDSSFALESGICPGITEDQRGFPRPVDHRIDVDTDAECDIGAVEVGPPLEAAVKVFLEGPYNGSGMSQGIAPWVPAEQPYDALPWEYGGDETIEVLPPPDLVDWVLIQLATGDPLHPPMNVERSRAALLTVTGMVENADAAGTDRVYFDDVLEGNYFIIVRHRNHLDVMSNGAWTLSTTAPGVINLTVADACFGSDPAKQLGGGVYGMFAGDGEPDGVIDALDREVHLDDTAFATTEYALGDYNMDRFPQALDFNLYLANYVEGAMSQVP